MRSECLEIHLADLKETQLFAERVARCLVPKLQHLQRLKQPHRKLNGGVKIYLSGNLGAGKTAWIAALLNAMGVVGNIKSPSYSLIEMYQLGQFQIAHIDAYRLFDGDDFLSSGLDDVFSTDLLLVEWYEKVENALPAADWLVMIDIEPEHRILKIEAKSDLGKDLLLEIGL